MLLGLGFIIMLIISFFLSPDEKYSSRIIDYYQLFMMKRDCLLNMLALNDFGKTLIVIKVIAYFVIIHSMFKFSIKSSHYLIAIYFTLSVLILTNKGGENFSPLFTWYFGFILFVSRQYKNKHYQGLA
jgi:hypothetical protein